MKIIIGKTSGFCGGVLRSITEAEKIINKYPKIYCLGELVHNPQVVHNLEGKGLRLINNLNEAEDGSKVIIRAHGVPKEIYESSSARNIEIFDLTCPKVLVIHNLAEKLVNEGYYIVLLGSKNHPEVIGTKSYCGNNSMVIHDIDELQLLYEDIKKSNINKIAIIAQTTYSLDSYNLIESTIRKDLGKDYEIFSKNTICTATELRQKETKELATKVDAMIIIGGKNSSNTKKLYEIAKELCPNTYIVETASELHDDFSKFKSVGIMAGASTPKESVDEVIAYLNKE